MLVIDGQSVAAIDGRKRHARCTITADDRLQIQPQCAVERAQSFNRLGITPGAEAIADTRGAVPTRLNENSLLHATQKQQENME